MNLKNISDWSYRRFGLFFKKRIEKDDLFDEKINKIIDLITKDNILDIEEIAQLSNCTLEECFFKINYLKNKKLIDEYYYIDKINKELKKCSDSEKRLLDKYSVYLYTNHYSLEEIAVKLPNATLNNQDILKESVLNDLKVLEEKGLLNGITINEVDKKIVYYSVEKHNKEKNYLTLECENCGALNDVNIGSKVRCEYCDTIIDGTDEELITYVKNKVNQNI